MNAYSDFEIQLLKSRLLRSYSAVDTLLKDEFKDLKSGVVGEKVIRIQYKKMSTDAQMMSTDAKIKFMFKGNREIKIIELELDDQFPAPNPKDQYDID